MIASVDKQRFTYQDIHRTVKSLARRIRESGYRADVIVAIGSGGFIPARMLRTFIDLPILTVGVAYYDSDNQPTANPRKVQWIEEAEHQLRGKRILLVDEVDDSRATLEYCVRELLTHRPKSIGVAVIHNKLKEKRGVMPKELSLYLAGMDIDDKWVCYPWDAADISEHDALAALERHERKKSLRSHMKRMLASVKQEERQAKGAQAASMLAAHPSFAGAELVLAFLSMPTEIDTGPVLDRALADGKRLAAPRIRGDIIEFVPLDRSWRGWPKDSWDIPVPPDSIEPLGVAHIAQAACLVLAPGLAFDQDGGRLGRGKGYYDRFLSGLKDERAGRAPQKTLTVLGYGYREQLVPWVPRGAHDHDVDGLILA